MKLSVRLGVFGAVPLGILQDKSVKPNSLKAYIALSSFQGTNDSCVPSLEKIAERAGIDSVPATSEAIRGLVAAGWVEKIRRGKGLTNEYRCLAKLDEPETTESPNPIPPENPKPISEKDETKAGLQIVEQTYFEVYTEIFGEKPAIYEFKKNRAIIKKRLRTVPVERLVAVIRNAKGDRWAKDAGFTVCVVLCEAMINRYGRESKPSSEVSDADLYGWELPKD